MDASVQKQYQYIFGYKKNPACFQWLEKYLSGYGFSTSFRLLSEHLATLMEYKENCYTLEISYGNSKNSNSMVYLCHNKFCTASK